MDGSATLKAMEKKYGYKLADGQDNMKGKIWRLSHMGYIDAFDVLGALAALELVLAEGGLQGRTRRRRGRVPEIHERLVTSAP